MWRWVVVGESGPQVVITITIHTNNSAAGLDSAPVVVVVAAAAVVGEEGCSSTTNSTTTCTSRTNSSSSNNNNNSSSSSRSSSRCTSNNAVLLRARSNRGKIAGEGQRQQSTPAALRPSRPTHAGVSMTPVRASCVQTQRTATDGRVPLEREETFILYNPRVSQVSVSWHVFLGYTFRACVHASC